MARDLSLSASPGNAVYSSYRGAWSATTSYFVGDEVNYYGCLYRANTTQVLSVATPSVIGQGGNSNGSASTTTTTATLPSGSAAGDLVLMTAVLGNYSSSSPSNLITNPSYGTKISGSYRNTTDYTSGAWSIYTYTLTASDITAGNLVFPIQGNGSTNANLAFSLTVIRNAALDAVSAAGTPFNSNAYPISVQCPAVSTTSAPLVVWQGLSLHDSIAPNSAQYSYSPVTPTASNTVPTTVLGGHVMSSYAPVSGGTVAAETLNWQWNAARLTYAFGMTYTFVGQGLQTFDFTKWDRVAGDSPPGLIQMYAAVLPPSGWILCDGSSQLRATYPALFNAISYSSTGTFNAASNTITNVPAAFVTFMSNNMSGWMVTSQAINSGNSAYFITGIGGSTSLTMSSSTNITANSNIAIQVMPYGATNINNFTLPLFGAGGPAGAGMSIPRGNTIGIGGGSDTHQHTFAHVHGLSAAYAMIGTAANLLRLAQTTNSYTYTNSYNPTMTNTAGTGTGSVTTQLGGNTDTSNPNFTSSASSVPAWTGVNFIIKL